MRASPTALGDFFISGMPAASLEFNHRAMSLKSIREQRNDQL
jgi:hypothetical protein